MKWVVVILVLVCCLLPVVFWRRLMVPERAYESPAWSAEMDQINEPILPIPLTSGLDPKRVALGLRLFGDPRLSHDDSIS